MSDTEGSIEDIKPKVAACFARHLVSIYAGYNDGACDISSGFVMEIDGIWFLTTAGHVIKDLNHDFEKGRLKKIRLVDSLGHEAKYKQTYPFDYARSRRAVIGDTKDVDYGLFVLDGLTVEGLQKNNIIPMDEEHWKNPPADGYDATLVIGTPAQFVNVAIEKDGEPMISGVTIIVANVEPIDDPPEELRSDFPRLYGKVAGTFNVGGMSGGLVVGVKRFKDGTKYWPVGIQSGWQESSRILTICPFKPFAEHVRDSLREARGGDGGP